MLNNFDCEPCEKIIQRTLHLDARIMLNHAFILVMYCELDPCDS
jgi:hypothetical protein